MSKPLSPSDIYSKVMLVIALYSFSYCCLATKDAFTIFFKVALIIIHLNIITLSLFHIENTLE